MTGIDHSMTFLAQFFFAVLWVVLNVALFALENYGFTFLALVVYGVWRTAK